MTHPDPYALIARLARQNEELARRSGYVGTAEAFAEIAADAEAAAKGAAQTCETCLGHGCVLSIYGRGLIDCPTCCKPPPAAPIDNLGPGDCRPCPLCGSANCSYADHGQPAAIDPSPPEPQPGSVWVCIDDEGDVGRAYPETTERDGAEAAAELRGHWRPVEYVPRSLLVAANAGNLRHAQVLREHLDDAVARAEKAERSELSAIEAAQTANNLAADAEQRAEKAKADAKALRETVENALAGYNKGYDVWRVMTEVRAALGEKG